MNALPLPSDRRHAPVVALTLLLAASLASAPVTAKPPQPSAADAPQVAPRQARLPGFTAPIPDGWVAETPQTSMRALQYRAPGGAEGPDAAFVVYHFGPGQGGSEAANIARWRSQFQGPDGGPVEPRVERFEVQGVPVTVVELTGAYARGVGIGPQGEALPDRTLLAAIVSGPEGNLYVQLHGPRAVVNRHREGFYALLHGLRAADR